MPETDATNSAGRHKLSLFDSTCLIVGIIIGSGIYETPASVAGAVDYPWEVFFLWTAGGIISLCGALCYAELASAYPESGGDLVYLSKAYGGWAGFLFGWLNTFVARPGDIALMALVFARYVHVLIGASNGSGESTEHPIWPAISIVALLTAINIVGLQFGKTAQNTLTVAKVLGLFLIIGAAFASGMVSEATATAVEATSQNAGDGRLSKGVALVLILFTYGGWNESVYVSSEVKDARRNIVRSLVFGVASVLVVYLIANAAYLSSLGLRGMAESGAIATDAVSGVLPRSGQMLVAAVIAISSAGAINGLVITGSRITGAMKSYPPFGWLGHWNSRFQTPVRALVLEALIAIVVISVFRTFEDALIFTSAAVYTFYLATSMSTAVLRFTDREVKRTFHTPLFPLPLLIFAAGCTFTIKSAIEYKPKAAMTCFAILLAGLLTYGLFVLITWLRSTKRDQNS